MRPVDVVITILLITGWSVVTETLGSPHSSGADDSHWVRGSNERSGLPRRGWVLVPVSKWRLMSPLHGIC